MWLLQPSVENTKKVQEYKNLNSRLEKIEKWIFVDFNLITPDKLEGSDFPNPYDFDPFGLGDSMNDARAMSWNKMINIEHKALQAKVLFNDNISKIFVVIDEFAKNPDVYLWLAEFIAEKDGFVLMKDFEMGKYKLKNIVKSWFDKKFKEYINSKKSHMLVWKKTYDDPEAFQQLITYLADNEINLPFPNISDNIFHSHISEKQKQELFKD